MKNDRYLNQDYYNNDYNEDYDNDLYQQDMYDDCEDEDFNLYEETDKRYFKSEYSSDDLEDGDGVEDYDFYFEDYEESMFDDYPDINFDEEEKTTSRKTRRSKKQTIDGTIDFNTPKNAKVDHSGPAVKARFYSIMEDYHSGDSSKRQYALERAMREMEGFIHLIIKRSYSTYTKKYFHDLLQEGYLGVAVGMKKYDPDISMPSTFFFPYIKHEMQGFITRNVDKTTSHYSSNIKKINKAIELLEEKGVQYTNVDIAIQTGMTIETVDQSLAIRNCRDEVHIDACPPNVIDAELEHSRIKTPEQELLENEEKNIVYRTMNTLLTEEEITVLEYHFGLNDVQTISEGEIAKKMRIPKDKVKKTLNRAIRKLRQSELSNLYNDSIKKDNKLLEEVKIAFVPREATESDIEFLAQIDSICDDD